MKTSDLNILSNNLINYNKITFVGIGNYHCSDDAIGTHIINMLIEEILNDKNNDITLLSLKNKNNLKEFLLVSAGTTVENYIEDIIKFNPQVLIFIDCANFNNLNEKPGNFYIFDESIILNQKCNISTHSLSIQLVIEILKQVIHNLKIYFIGITPKTVDIKYESEYYNNMSSEVLKCGIKIKDFIKNNLLLNTEVLK